MIRILIVLLAALSLQLSQPTAAPAARDARLSAVRTWAFGIGDGMLRGDVARRFAAYDLVVLDGEDASREQVAALRARGKIVLAYISVGTIERPRGWYRDAKPYRLEFWPDWGEWYANVAKAGYRNLIAGKVAPGILAKGFDGLFLDNTDMVERHPRQRDGMRKLVESLSQVVHGRRGYLFSQNGEDSIGRTLRFYDGWNREDVTWTYDFDRRRYVRQSRQAIRDAQAALRRIGRTGLLVTATDYTRARDSAAAAEATRNACAAGALSFVSDIGLRRLPSPLPHC